MNKQSYNLTTRIYVERAIDLSRKTFYQYIGWREALRMYEFVDERKKREEREG